MKNIVLFDLDGTLTDSSEGILNSVRYMLEKKGLEIPDEATLHSFIGPPLTDTLMQLYGVSEKVKLRLRSRSIASIMGKRASNSCRCIQGLRSCWQNYRQTTV